MPIYEYRCGDCEHRFEELVRSMQDQTGVACPACGGQRVERQLSTFAPRQADGASRQPAPRPGGCQGCAAADGSCPYQT